MSYGILVALAVSAGLLFGALPPAGWPWRRPNPVRATVSVILPLVGLVILLVGHFRRWDEGNASHWAMLTGIAVPLLVASWIAPKQRLWERLAMTVFVLWLVYAWGTHAAHLL